MKKLLPVISILMVVVFALSACTTPTAAPVATEAPVVATEAPVATEAAPEPVTIVLWTKEGEADGGLQYVQGLADAFTALYPYVTFEVVNKEVETLREDFQTSSLAGDPPDLLWTVSDHAGPFTTAGLIQPVDGLFDMTKYVESVVMNGETWAVPISSGNHLMLLYNKSLVPTAPTTTDELIQVAQTLTAGDVYGFAYNQTEPFFANPWLGGFGGKVFAEDGVTPTLNTPEMIATMQFLYDIKFTTPIMPLESDYNGADALFKEGKAAMIVNGDWSLAGYKEALGDNFGVAPLPKVSATGLMPAPMTSGVYFMIPVTLEGAKLDAVKLFVEFVTNLENQTSMVTTLARLPGSKEALTIDAITSDPILKASSEAMSYGTPMPTVVEMRCVWDSWKPEMIAMLASATGTTPADAAANMQTAAEACISQLE
jgi:arabinogalactan oligomer/maltooligosaccharide transport system substrate-binding protein